MKSIELGKQTKEKTLILDMNETIIATKFDGKERENFVPDFSFDYLDTKIYVRIRPFLADVL